ncbi:acyl-CoA N-acyltransferases super family protein [Striga asiatica]|uniref:Acyl-CoA N-acyltransferases super family protein n=1 Tax=Striga asiatica TaxID=4170 RepID=A0A5A7PZ14_STRAF|nr:acyl-CoA N-acyltransferases super family protein [Striga asiatica]
MAHLHCTHSSIVVKQFKKELFLRKINSHNNLSFKTEQNSAFKKNKRLVCLCSYSTSADQQVNSRPKKLDSNGGAHVSEKLLFGYLVSHLNWQVRRMADTEEETKRVAYIQAEAFHEPVFMFNDMFFGFFKAEVLSGLMYRLRNSPPDRYACLVAEPESDYEGSNVKELVGVVDVTVQREDYVLEHLKGVEEYLYVSGIAVLNKFRRQKVATVLLKACDELSAIWGFEYLVLRAYEDDYGAQKLYSNAGYRVISRDPSWMSSWIGRRRRVLMVKRSNTW